MELTITKEIKSKEPRATWRGKVETMEKGLQNLTYCNQTITICRDCGDRFQEHET